MANFLVVINAWYSKKLVTGGESHMLQVLKNWTLRDNIALLIPKMGYQATKNLLKNVNLFYFSSKEEDDEIKSTFKLVITYFVRTVRSIMVRPKHKPDIIITASHFFYDVLPATILCRRFNSKLLVYSHGTLRNFRSYNTDLRSNLMILNEKLSLFLCKRSADAIFAISDETKDFLVSHGFESNRITIMRNGVDHDLINSVKVKEKKYQASFCGRLVKRKGVYDLLEIWERVLKFFPDNKLVIMGQGLEYDGLKEAISRNGWEKNIILTGYVPDNEKIAFFKSSEIFIFPSYEEAWGIAITEAMACGLPVVCYDLPAYNLLKDGIIKSNLGDKDLITKSIIDLLHDDNKRMVLANAAREEGKKLDWHDIAKEELTLVHMILNK
jgi:glycosyltransferase involved in cell wall biosynthesis